MWEVWKIQGWPYYRPDEEVAYVYHEQYVVYLIGISYQLDLQPPYPEKELVGCGNMPWLFLQQYLNAKKTGSIQFLAMCKYACIQINYDVFEKWQRGALKSFLAPKTQCKLYLYNDITTIYVVTNVGWGI